MAGVADINPSPPSVAPNLGTNDEAEWNNLLRRASAMGSNIGEKVEAMPVGERTGRPDYGGGTAAATSAPMNFTIN